MPFKGFGCTGAQCSKGGVHYCTYWHLSYFLIPGFLIIVSIDLLYLLFILFSRHPRIKFLTGSQSRNVPTWHILMILIILICAKEPVHQQNFSPPFFLIILLIFYPLLFSQVEGEAIPYSAPNHFNHFNQFINQFRISINRS